MTFVLFVNGIVILFTAILMAVDALFFADTREIFALSAIVSGALGGMLAISASSDFSGFRRIHAFAMTSSVWMTAALAGGLPLWLWHLGPADAFFEAMSGITTTGSTVMSGLDTTPRGILMWRALLQALGGVGFVVAGMALLPVMRVGGMQLYQTESSEKGDKPFRSAAQFAFATLAVYAVLIVLCALVYEIGGMNVFDAVTHAMTTLSSGGYSNYDASFGHFTSPFLQWACTLFMLAAGLPFAWYLKILTRGTARSEQVRMMLITLAIVIGALTIWQVIAMDEAPGRALRLVAFNVVSVVTTTGYATADYLTWGPVAAVAFFLLTPVGGCTGSTAGGVKAMRWIILARSAMDRIREIAAPHGVFVTRYEGRKVSDDVLAGVMSFFFFFIATVALLAMMLSQSGMDLSTAISGALTAVANVGPGVGAIIGPAGNFATLPSPDKVLLALGMYAGRLELLTVLVLIMPAYWREV